jgi:hypothetical protein
MHNTPPLLQTFQLLLRNIHSKPAVLVCHPHSSTGECSLPCALPYTLLLLQQLLLHVTWSSN